MLKISVSEIYDLSIEEIIEKAAPNYISKIEKYEKLAIDEPEILAKLKHAKLRVIQPLELPIILKCIVFPFGISNSFTADDTTDIKRFKTYGYIRKSKAW